MVISLKHTFTSTKPEGVDTLKVRTSNWNAEHALSLATDKLLGRVTAGTGAVEEITFTDFAQTLLDDASAADARTTLGLGTVATENVIPVAKGGTGQTTAAEALGEMIQSLTGDALPDGALDYLVTYDASDDTGKKVLISNLPGQLTTATQDTNFYVRTDGNDANDGLTNTPGGAKLTIQGALDEAHSYDWVHLYRPIINVADGTYNVGVGCLLPDLNNPGPLAGRPRLNGNLTTPANVVVNGTGDVFQVLAGSRWRIMGFKIASTSAGSCVAITGEASLGDLIFADSADHCISVGQNGYMFWEFGTGLTVSVISAWGFLRAFEKANVFLDGCTVVVDSAFTCTRSFVEASGYSRVSFTSVTFNVTGSVTGPKYEVGSAASYDSNSVALDSLPGSTAGIRDDWSFIERVASTANTFKFLDATTNNKPSLSAVGTDANVGMDFAVKGSPPSGTTVHAVRFDLGGAPDIAMELKNSPGSGSGPRLRLFNNSTSPVAFDSVGGVALVGNDSGGNKTNYAIINGAIRDTTNGSEDGAIEFFTIRNGSLTGATAEIASGLMVGGGNDPGFGGIRCLKLEVGADADTTVTRSSAGVLAVEGVILARHGTAIVTLSTTVGALPSAATAGSGARAFVTDANATTFLSTVAGGGANKVPVVSDGTNWLIG